MSTKKWICLWLLVILSGALVWLVSSPIGKELSSIPGTHTLYPHDLGDRRQVELVATRNTDISIRHGGGILVLRLTESPYDPLISEPPTSRTDVTTVFLRYDPIVHAQLRTMQDIVQADIDQMFDYDDPPLKFRIDLAPSGEGEPTMQLVRIVQFRGQKQVGSFYNPF